MTRDENEGGGASRPLRDRPDETVIVRHEEEIGVDKGWRGIGFLRARKRAQIVKVREEVPLDLEQLVQERVPAAEGDSGEIETLPDGSLSIPLYEEQLVVTKRTVLRERMIIRKEIVTRSERVEAELRSEQVEIDADDEVDVIDERLTEEDRHADRQARRD